MKLKKIITKLLSILILTLAVFSPRLSHAASYVVETLPDKTVYNDFVVGPGKYQVDMKPGEKKVVNLIVTNRLGKEKTFQLQTEDFTGSKDIDQTVVLLEGERGPYSLKDYLKIPSTTFTMGNAQRVTIPVTISIPTDAQPGGLYGSVVISTVTTGQEQVPQGDSSVGTSPIITRIGSLFFIRIAGEVKEDINLKKFSLKNDASVMDGGPVNFELLYENNGTVHENPKGFIYIKNLFGAEIGKVEVEPWFILPNSLRQREVNWKPQFLFGRYVATAEIVKGYDNQKDTVSVVFWVIPWRLVALVFAALVIVVSIVRWLASKISISVKK